MDVPDAYAAEIPDIEPERLRALHSLDILDTQRDTLMDSLTEFARLLFEVPIVLISLVDTDRLWFKSKCGLVESEHPRERSFCTRLVATNQPFIMVEDATLDPVIARNPLVRGSAHLRFYAGCALRSKDGYLLGSFCLLDTKPGSLTQLQIAQLKHLASIVETLIRNYGENRQASKALIQHAFYDPVTQLPTRALLCERIRGYQTLGDDSAQSVTLAIINPKRFRTLNQLVGREQGDQILGDIAARLANAIPDHGVLARLHEDRFAVLVTTHDDGTEPDLPEYLRQALMAPFSVADRLRQLDFSIGVVKRPFERIGAPDDLIEQAQLAVGQDRQRVGTFITSLSAQEQSDLAAESSLESRLRVAIDNAELEMHYQPIVRLADQKVIGVEALVRWYSDGAWIPPSQFVPVAEESGLIHTISEWILENACAQFQSALGTDNELYLSVNISAHELYATDFVSRVEQALVQSGLSPHRLCLEVTEHSLIHDMPMAIRQMQRLVDCGVHFAIDDFGTGFASLRYLQLLPVDTLKIDRCFVGGLPHDNTDASITRATIALANSLGLKVISEGMETPEQVRFLQDEGIVSGQGWYYAKAESIDGIRDRVTH